MEDIFAGKRSSRKCSFVYFVSWYLNMPYETIDEIKEDLSKKEFKKVSKKYAAYLESKYLDPADFIDFC